MVRSGVFQKEAGLKADLLKLESSLFDRSHQWNTTKKIIVKTTVVSPCNRVAMVCDL